MPTWIRVRDDVTGDEFDVNERSLRRGMTRVEGYPERSGPGARPRPAKLRVAKNGTRIPPDAPTEPAPADAPDNPVLMNPEEPTEPAAEARPADNTEENQ